MHPLRGSTDPETPRFIQEVSRETITGPGGRDGRKANRELQQGDRFPSLTLRLVDALCGTIRIPAEMPSRYVVLLFYRGHW